MVGPDILTMVRAFFSTGSFPTLLNHADITLIPKIPNPICASDFCPISLCNFGYKIVSKILANRLKNYLPKLITLYQSAFVADRQIQDNILIAHEMFHYMKTFKNRGAQILDQVVPSNLICKMRTTGSSGTSSYRCC